MLHILNQVKDIVREASKLMLTKDFEIQQKGDIANIVTSSDVAVQEFLCQQLSQVIPGSGFLCEENDVCDTCHPYTWVIDPIDGTCNYARGIDQCAISVGLRHYDATHLTPHQPNTAPTNHQPNTAETTNHQPNTAEPTNHQQNTAETTNHQPNTAAEMVMGVVYLPRTDEMFHAIKGQGAFRNDQPIHVSDRAFNNSVMCTALAVYHKEHAQTCSDIIVDTFLQINDIRRFGAAAPELCYLAMGRCELYFEYLLSPWDYAGASVILTEAGGFISDLRGNPVDGISPSGILAGNTLENLQRLQSIVAKHL